MEVEEETRAANTASVKSDDSSPQTNSGRGSPPPNCAICLGNCKNKSFTDSCLHQFCFSCLLTWSKVKAECPLCKQNFRSIIHNVRSNHQYEEYLVVQQPRENVVERIDISNITNAARRFRYRTTLTLPRRDSMAIQQLLLLADVYPPPAPRAPLARRRREPASFRRTVYRHNLWARPLPDFTGRFRDCSPDFYRYNDAQMHRLVPWLNRELYYLLNENVPHISYVLTRILELLPQYHINSPEFCEALNRYFGDRTEHFLHELYCFASTPYDMTGYDRNVQYTTDPRISTLVNEVISSSESDNSVDSDIVMVSHSEPAVMPTLGAPAPGPSRQPPLLYGYNLNIPDPNNSVIPIETISHSDTDDDSEVMVVGYIKPPQERTPEVVDLLGSDSDVVVQDNPQPGPSQPVATQESSTATPLVKLTLKRHLPTNDVSDSDDSCLIAPRKKSRTKDSSRSWSSDSSYVSSSLSSWTSSSSPASTSCSSEWRRNSSTSDASTWTTSSSDQHTRRKFKKKRSKTRSKTSKANDNNDHCSKSKSQKRKKAHSSPSRNKEKKDKHSKKKSKSNKDVKSSKRSSAREEQCSGAGTATAEPSTSGISTSPLRQTLSSEIECAPSTSGFNGSSNCYNNEPSINCLDTTNPTGSELDSSQIPDTSMNYSDVQPCTSGTRVKKKKKSSKKDEDSSKSKKKKDKKKKKKRSSSKDTRKEKSRKHSKKRSGSKDSKKIKSVVNVRNNQQTSNSDSPNNSNLLSILSDAILNPNSNVLAYNSDSGSVQSENRNNISNEIDRCFNVQHPANSNYEQRISQSQETESDDDVPLNYSMKRS